MNKKLSETIIEGLVSSAAQRAGVNPKPEVASKHEPPLWSGGRASTRKLWRIGTLEDKIRWMLNQVIEDERGCWLWPRIAVLGYGHLKAGGKQWKAHRMMFSLVNGDIPTGLFACHRCDVKNCINPAHLFLGTALDNNRDCCAKGRHFSPPGELHPNALLTESSVRMIRAHWEAGRTQISISKEFGVSNGTVRAVVVRQTWNHVH